MHRENKLSIKVFCLIPWLCLLMAGCQKEGVYKPGKKVSKIYTTYESGEKKLYQTWNWDGDLLKSIIFFDDRYELKFEYKNKQLVSITQLDSRNIYYQFHYNKSGQRLDSLDVYKDWPSHTPNVLHIAHYDFSYNKEGRISGYEEEIYAYPTWKDGDEALSMVLQCAIPGLPDVAARKIATPRKQSKGDEVIWDRVSVSFAYQGENVTKCHIITTNETSYKDEETFSLTYTDYLNPLYKLFQSANISSTGLYSRNLVNSYHYVHKRQYFDGFESETDYYEDAQYTYELDGQFPIKITCDATYVYDLFPDYPATYQYVNYYEYY